MHIHVLDEGGLGHPVSGTGWRSLIGCLKLQVIFRKRATNYRALWRKITCKDKASSESTPPCSIIWGAASKWATQTADCNILRHTPTHCSAPNNTGVSTAPDSLLATLQHAATRCNTLQHVATRCSKLQHTASHCITLQRTAKHWTTHVSLARLVASSKAQRLYTATWCNTLHRTATHQTTQEYVNTFINIRRQRRGWQSFLRRSVYPPQYTATHCNTLQHTATHSNALQHTKQHRNM